MQVFQKLTFVVLTLLTIVTSAVAETRPIDVLHYDLQLDLKLENKGLYTPLNELDGRAIIRVKNISDSDVTTIPVILHRLMKIETVKDGKDNPLDFEARLTALDGWETFHVNAVNVSLSSPLAQGGEMTVEINYKGQMIGYPETGMLYVRDRLDPEFTIIRYETFSYPQIASPSKTAVSAARRSDAFDYRFTATVPKGLVVAHGSRLVKKKKRGETTTYTYESTQPDTVMIFPIAPYERLRGGAADFLFFAEDAAGAERLAQAAELTFALYRDWFGERVNGEDRITFIEIPEFFGSQASNPTIIQTAAAYKGASSLSELYHEISHLWNPPEPGIAPSRWNEGFATFISYLADDHFTGASNLGQQLDSLLSSAQRRLDSEPAWRALPMKDFGSGDATSLSYSAGGLFFALVHRTLGDEAFIAFYRNFYRIYGQSGATSDEFAAFAESYDNAKVTAIFSDWMLSARWADIVVAANSFEDVAGHYE